MPGKHPSRGFRSIAKYAPRPALIFTSAFLVLLAFSFEQSYSGLGIVMVIAVLALVIVFYNLFRASRFFVLALANLIGVYACIFIFFAESNFRPVTGPILWIGFLAPLIAFLVGSFWRRHVIQHFVLSGETREVRDIARIVAWLAPVMAIGAASFLVPADDVGPLAIESVFLGAMGAIATIVLFVSRDIAVFLFDTALLFEEFFRRVAMRLAPAFAFLTFYSLLVIVFAAIYSLVDGVSSNKQFRVLGVLHSITFPESLYFSLTTLSTVGYGDISPATNLTRMLVGIEIICGILLLLFGFNEIISYSRERQSSQSTRDQR